MARGSKKSVPIEAPREVRMVWRGPVVTFLRDETRLVDLEGALRSGKTTACLWKEHTKLMQYPGMASLLCRWSDADTEGKLKPPWRAICQTAATPCKWNPDEQYDELPNGSRAYIFGLKAADQTLRYSKLRGLTVARIYNDQTEEVPYDVFLELCARLSQPNYPQQATFSPNPTSPNHWLAQEFPEDNRESGKRYIRLSVYDNAHNLSPDTIRGLEKAFPPGHAKHRPMVWGLRGLNVIGEPCYRGAFQRAIHERPLAYEPDWPLCEAIDFGKHHPCIVWGQFPPTGGLHLLGGVLGQNVWLEEFLPMAQAYRALWFPHIRTLQTCCDPAGTHDHGHGIRENALQVVKRFYPVDHQVVYRENSNAPDVRVAMVERIAGHMRRRSTWGEAFAIDGTRDEQGETARWVRVSKDGPQAFGFVADACEAGYVWDEHFVSVGSKQVRKPKKDGWYEHGMNCVEYLELNFGGGQATQAEEEARTIRQRSEASSIAPTAWSRDRSVGWMS